MADDRGPTRSGSAAVAVEVSALHGTTHRDAEFVAFALASLEHDAGVSVVPWSVHRGRTQDLAEQPRRTRAWVGHRAGATGLRVPSKWAAPQSDAVFFASGPLDLHPSAPALVTVQLVDGPGGLGTSRRRCEQLRRAVGEGVVLHATTESVAAALAERLGVPRAAIVVVAPGVRVTTTITSRTASVVVLGGADAARDHEVLEALRVAGLDAELAAAPHDTPPAACAVLASPDEGFPTAAMEVLAAGGPVVSTRTSTTTALFEGAARLVDSGATTELVDAAVDVVRSDASRSIASAAGLARAQDYSWACRGPALVQLVRRAMARA